MLLYRIASARHAKDLSGVGAEKYGGRWNQKGVPVLYVANTMSLCALEALVHAGDSVGPMSRVMVTCQLPDDISTFVPDVSTLPTGWDDLPSIDGGPSSQFGQQWVERQEELIMVVPSVVMPKAVERSVVVNVKHPDFRHLKITHVEPFSFDSRLIP